MAKRTTIQLLKRACNKCNEPEPTSFVGVIDGTRAYQIYNALTEALKFIYNTNKGKWRFAEVLGTGTFVTGTNKYSVATDCNIEDVYSFKVGNDHVKKAINYLDSNKFENKFPYVDPTLDTGWPSWFSKFNNQYEFDVAASTNQNGHFWNYRYWKYENSVSTASASSTATATGATPTYTATTLIPEQFEELLTDLAAMYQLDFEGDPQANTYRVKVFGGRLNDKEIRGGLNELKDLQNSVERTTANVNIIL